MKIRSVLFVCAGNICRSPLAEGIFGHVLANAGRQADFHLDSAGTGGWHEGDKPDPRSINVAKDNGIDISKQRARKIRLNDYSSFHLILAMDRDNLANLKRLSSLENQEKIHLFQTYTTGTVEDIPDPYYGGPEDFEQVYRMLSKGCSALLNKL